MKAEVDDELCRGHGVCWSLCPEVFDLTGQDYAVVRTPDVPADLEDKVRTAAANCPERAITVTIT